MTVYKKIIASLQKQGIKFKVCEHEAEGRCDVISMIRGNALSQAMKAIIIMAKLNKKKRKYFSAVVPGDQALDLNAIKKYSQASSVMFAPIDRAKTLTECEMGAVPPFTFNKELHLIADPSITQNKEIVFNAGVLDRSIFMDVYDYIKVANPVFVDIIKKTNIDGE